MKIGVITICDYNNYGNRLQNYALQEVLKSFNCQVETICNTQFKEKKLSIIQRLNRIIRMQGDELLIKLEEKIKGDDNKSEKLDFAIGKSISDRQKAIRVFTDKYIKETKFTLNPGEIPEDLAESYDYVIVGSDQVWNPIFRKGSPLDFLTFAPEFKRIAYAPSFGVTSIPDEYVDRYRKWLSEMNCLSVREEDGARIIKDLTGRDAPVLIDPTLMLSQNKWCSIKKVADVKPKNKYLLTYFLGNVSIEDENFITKFASENEYEVVNLANIKDKDYFTAGPDEFVDYFYSASVVFTDSFHGTIFSIIFEKPFVVFDRLGNLPSMQSRIDTLLSTFKLNNRKWDQIKINRDIFDIDYSHVPAILHSERNKALQYLNDALHSEKKDQT